MAVDRAEEGTAEKEEVSLSCAKCQKTLSPEQVCSFGHRKFCQDCYLAVVEAARLDAMNVPIEKRVGRGAK